LQIETFVLGSFESNCYLIRSDDNNPVWLIDPGGDPASVIAHLESKGLQPAAVLLTHCHLDHIFGVGALKRAWPQLPVICPEGDLPLYRNLPEQANMFGLKAEQLPDPERLLQDAGTVFEQPWPLRALPTPGHSPGSTTFCLTAVDGSEMLFTGDTLFRESVGRTDLWGGDWDELESSVRERLYAFPATTRVLPGHGPETTIGWEREHNQFFRA